MQFAFDVDMSDVLKGVERMKTNGQDLRPIWKAVRGIIKSDVDMHFQNEEGPSAAWPYWSPKTVQRISERKGMRYKRGKRRGTLSKRGQKRLSRQKMLGRLKTAWNFYLTPHEFIMQNRVPWADVHQKGGTSGRGSRIPARPFAWVSDRVVGIVGQAVAEHTAEAFASSAPGRSAAPPAWLRAAVARGGYR